ncbi:MAG: hypothetical protein ACRYG8_01465 [Janthinobacterium lividum]
MCDNKTSLRLCRPMTSAPDPHGQAALMLCESLAYLLIEQRLVGQQQVIDAIEGVIEVKQEMARVSEPVVVSITSILLLQDILNSIRAVPVPQDAARKN